MRKVAITIKANVSESIVPDFEIGLDSEDLRQIILALQNHPVNTNLEIFVKLKEVLANKC